ncbi:hypothetical protein K2173_000859 [Erythroxylum novogranatense]|uniref:Pectinesterase inhibitor domain-containing protein n=1 Tax=Erythroxylum novogranatense TaxID=1862640 RepID=A0AAV8S7W7_9ROSI|nr:hypothetical protein K2173_000859 [Erythroxylum novogranatense]
MEPKNFLLLLLSSSLLSVLVDSVCVPRNATEQGAPAPAPSYSSDSRVQPPSLSPDFELPHAPTLSESTSSASSTLDLAIPSIEAPALQKICGITSYPEKCLQSITPFLSGGASDPVSILKMEVKALRGGFENGIRVAKKMMEEPSTDDWIKSCLDTCVEVFEGGMYDLDDALGSIASKDLHKLQILLSAGLSYVSTCEDSFGEQPDVESPLKEMNKELDQLASNTLAICSSLKWN